MISASSAFEERAAGLERFAARVLMRTRSGTGVAVYHHADGSWGYIARSTDDCVTRTTPRNVSFRVRCRGCGLTPAVCTTLQRDRCATPCLCCDAAEQSLVVERLPVLFAWPEIHIDTFAGRVFEEVSKHESFALQGMVRGFVQYYWPMMGRSPDPLLWANFYISHGRKRAVSPLSTAG
jgi:hypothetical protein